MLYYVRMCNSVTEVICPQTQAGLLHHILSSHTTNVPTVWRKRVTVNHILIISHQKQEAVCKDVQVLFFLKRCQTQSQLDIVLLKGCEIKCGERRGYLIKTTISEILKSHIAIYWWFLKRPGAWTHWSWTVKEPQNVQSIPFYFHVACVTQRHRTDWKMKKGEGKVGKGSERKEDINK